MSRKAKLNEIKKIRLIRDELLVETNWGRCRTIINRLSLVRRVITYEQFMNNKVEITLVDGFEYRERGEGAFVKLIDIIYNKYLEKYCN